MRVPLAGVPLAGMAAVTVMLGCATRAPQPPALSQPAGLEQALIRAGANRPELERVLAHFAAAGDVEKLAAAHFLITHMPAHGFVEWGRFDAEGRPVAFDPLAYDSFDDALRALDGLEAEHGPLRAAPRRVVPDLEAVTAGLLIDNIDLAFDAWRGAPWAGDVADEIFREFVLPHRGSNEPLSAWRPALRERLTTQGITVAAANDPVRAGQQVWKQTRAWVAFSERFYLHPTDQAFDEMLARGEGRCEDQANLATYAARAVGVPAAQDFTPFWADRDNNHAWEVLLDADGRGHAPLAHRAAKVYRRAYSTLPDGPLAHVVGPSALPPELPKMLVRDVTDQYMATTDLPVRLERRPAAEAPLAYAAVFNAGEWRAVHWGRVTEREVLFTRLGRGVVYLPALYEDGALVGAAAPVVLDETGDARSLDGVGAGTVRIALVPDVGSAPTETVPVEVPGNGEHELFVWKDGWQSVLRHEASRGVRVVDVNAARLYWLVADGSRRLERIFSVENGRQVLW